MYEKGQKVFITKYSPNRVVQISKGQTTSVESLIDEGTYNSPHHDGYHSVWVDKEECFESVGECDLHLTKEAASHSVLRYIQVQQDHLTAQMDRLNNLEELFKISV